jgi:hypothetical protein
MSAIVNQDWRRSEIAIALNAIRGEICSTNFSRRGLFTLPRPVADRWYATLMRSLEIKAEGNGFEPSDRYLDLRLE